MLLKFPSFRLWLLQETQITFSGEGCEGAVVNVIFKGEASAKAVHVCQFLDEGKLHISWMRENRPVWKGAGAKTYSSPMCHQRKQKQLCSSTGPRVSQVRSQCRSLDCHTYSHYWERVFEPSAAWKRAWRFGHVNYLPVFNFCNFREIKLHMLLDKNNLTIGK